jgi:hypothetical protein
MNFKIWQHCWERNNKVETNDAALAACPWNSHEVHSIQVLLLFAPCDIQYTKHS